MATSLPDVLRHLLDADVPARRDRAWSAFVSEYTPLLLHAARSLGGDQDAVMDRYTYILEQLARDDFRRLRGYVVIGRTRFTTWLVVVARRLCLDQHRGRYGRVRGEAPAARGEGPAARAEARAERRRLAELVGDGTPLEVLRDETPGPESVMRETELRGTLGALVAELEPADRLLLALRFEDDLPAAEIARTLGFPSPFHVYRRVNRLLARLRELLEERGVRDALA